MDWREVRGRNKFLMIFLVNIKNIEIDNGFMRETFCKYLYIDMLG